MSSSESTYPMPRPISRSSAALSYHFGIVKERPNHAIGIALVASEWANLEVQIITLFKRAMFPSLPNETEAAYVASRAWDAMQALATRLDFIASVARAKMPSNLLEEFVKQIQPEIRSRARERNRVVHGHWKTCAEFPDDLILDSSTEGLMRYAASDFDVIASRIQGTTVLVVDYWERAQNHLQPLPPEDLGGFSTHFL